MAHTYILVIWTIVGYAGTSSSTWREYDWRPIGEFHMEEGHVGKSYKTAKEMCEDAARELALKSDKYRCVRSK